MRITINIIQYYPVLLRMRININIMQYY